MADTVAKFVSQKISKIRWRPRSKQDIRGSEVFATGSWDDTANRVSVWSVGEGRASRGEPGMLPILESEPELLCDAGHQGDVTDLQYVTPEVMVVASSSGSVSLYKHHTNSQTLSSAQSWDKLHHIGERRCPCTGLAVKDTADTVVTVGEDGRLNVIALEQRQPIRIIGKGDSCTLNAVSFLKQYEVGTVNSTGQLKVWDLRQHSDDPVRTFFLSGERVPLHCLDKHPTQPHIVATGGQETTLCIWDMRQDKFPVTLLSAHSADMWEVKFHPSHPDHLFTCSEDGSVWHWDGTSMNAHMNTSSALPTKGMNTTAMSMSMSMTGPGGNTSRLGSSYTSPWLASDASKHRLDVTDVLPGNTMPVNTLDIESNTLLCGTDGEQVYTVKNLAIQ